MRSLPDLAGQSRRPMRRVARPRKRSRPWTSVKVVMKTAAETAESILSLRRGRGMPAPVRPTMPH